MDFGRNDRSKNFRSGVSPWQGGGPGGDLPNLLPLGGGPTEATLALASNIINLLQPRQNPVPSLLDMPIRRDFGPNMNRYDRGYGPNRMGNQGNFRRTGNYTRAGERMNNSRKPFRPNDGPRQQNKSSPKKETDSKAKPVKDSEGKDTDKSEKTEDDKRETPKTRYDDINPQLLKCHICNKSMWDGRSFENHLSGRAHSIMMQKTAESYALTADTMRQEFKIREMKRTRKTGQQTPRDFYCAMCDMYAADGAIHRTTVGHRKLKKYLHPTCTSCHKEMPTRIELDEHRLTAEHLKNMQDKQEVVSKPKPEVMIISTLNMEQMYLRDDRQRWRRGDRNNKDKDEGEKDAEVKKEEGEAEPKKEEGDTEVDTEVKEKETEEKRDNADNDNTVMDYKEGDDVANVKPDQLPVYSTERGVGRSFLSPFSCVQCTLCRKLLDSEETAAVHLRTWRHHQLFVRLLQEKAGHQTSQPAESRKRTLNNDDTGTWKRRKTVREEDDEDQSEQNEANGHDDTAKEEATEAEGDTEGQTFNEEGDGDLPAAEELEDWEQSVDEILNDENDEEPNEPEPEQEQETKPEEEPAKPEPEEAPKASPAKAAPVGLARGRPRRH